MASEKRTMYYTEGSVVRKRDVYMAEPARRPQQRPDVQRRPKTYKRAAEKAEREAAKEDVRRIMKNSVEAEYDSGENISER